MSKDIVNIGNRIAFRCDTNHYFWFDTFCVSLQVASFMRNLNNPVKVLGQKYGYSLLITATYHLRTCGKTDYI